ncbi:type II toxin-antitoxin system VapC family toxin [Candidatus Binatia bacterium]|nr:type II toxin-antitoxin system VapC family toxin [Candidatus Binatia bacterium]
MKLLLDTHVWWWWVTGEQGLSVAQKRLLAKVDPENPVHVSDISLWEVATLASLGRLSLDIPLRDWLEAAASRPLVERLPISPAVAAEVAALPDSFHRDPADRIIVATARIHDATLLTRDRRITDAELVATVR